MNTRQQIRRADNLIVLEPVAIHALPDWSNRVRYVRRAMGREYALVVASI